jgi:hypothetical protein
VVGPILVLGWLAAGCAGLPGIAPGPSPVVTVVDIDGPTVHVSIDGRLVADVACGFASRIPIDRPVAAGGVIRVKVTADDGQVLDERDVPLRDGNLRLVVRRDGVLLTEKPPPYAPEPSADCPDGGPRASPTER